VVDQLEKKGAEVISITIPHLEEMKIAQIFTIGSEMYAGLNSYYQQHKYRSQFGDLPSFNLKIFESFTASDFLQAQKIKTMGIQILNEIFQQVDVIVTPSVSCKAPKYPLDGSTVFYDSATVTKLMRYVFLGNLTGNPGITFPCGYDEHGLPIGFQIYGRMYEEDLVLKVASVGEQFLDKKRPKVYYDIL